MPKTIRELSPGTVLAGTLILSALPLLIVELFPARLKFVVDAPPYIVFHNIAEFFSIMVSLSMFGMGWFTYDQSKNRHALFLGTAFLAIGLMDFMHSMGMAGMPDFFTPNHPNKSTQFWVAVRLFQGAAFLASAFVYPDRPIRWLSKKVLMSSSLLVSMLVFTAITFFPAYMPTTFVPGVGLTPFKKISEYVVIVLLGAAGIVYWRRMARTGERLLIYYLTAFVICIFSELVFAFYTRVYDTYNVLGHIYKVAAFSLIYYGVYKASVKAPYLKLREVGEKLTGEKAINRIFEKALNCDTEEELGRMCLAVAEELTDSKFGFIDELGPDGCLHDIAISDPGWELCAMDDKTGHRRPLEAFKIHGLYGQVVLEGKSLLANDPASHPASIGIPDGHPQLKAFLGVPLIQGGKTIGLVVVGNREGGYRPEQQESLEALAPAILQALLRKRTEEELGRYRQELEIRVEERTRELQEAQRYAQSIVETIREPLVVLGADLRVVSANSAFYTSFKVTPPKTEGQFIYDIGNRQWNIPRLRALLEEIVPTNTYFQDFEVDHEFPSIGRRDMLLNARRIYQEGKGTQMILLAVQDITEHKRADEALRESERRLRDLSSQLLVSQENERRKIAGEIHDGLGQVLSSAKFKLEDGIKQTIEGSLDQGAASLKLSLSILQEAIDEARRIQLDLRPAILDDLGIVATLSWFSRRLQTTHPEIRIEQETGIREEEIPEALKTVIYRILQEAFNNVVKYSQADLVHLSLSKANGTIELTIRDNGRGFDLAEVTSPERTRKGLGLTSMRERANLSGGSCRIESSKGTGTVIRASWPLGHRG
ncbi:MAG: GAF domain-containing protein [Deltaproteobacteria bacterium]|nr:GAF domain-containing protein [Deltaproteobacteria bacterium]